MIIKFEVHRLKQAYTNFKVTKSKYEEVKKSIVGLYCTCRKADYTKIEEHSLGCRYRQLLKSVED